MKLKSFFTYFLATTLTIQQSIACIDGVCRHESDMESDVPPHFVSSLEVAFDQHSVDFTQIHTGLKNTLYEKITTYNIPDRSHVAINETLGEGVEYPNKVIASFSVVGADKEGKPVSFDINISKVDEQKNETPLIFASSLISETKKGILQDNKIDIHDDQYCIVPDYTVAAKNVATLLEDSQNIFQRHLYKNTVDASEKFDLFHESAEQINVYLFAFINSFNELNIKTLPKSVKNALSVFKEGLKDDGQFLKLDERFKTNIDFLIKNIPLLSQELLKIFSKEEIRRLIKASKEKIESLNNKIDIYKTSNDKDEKKEFSEKSSKKSKPSLGSILEKQLIGEEKRLKEYLSLLNYMPTQALQSFYENLGNMANAINQIKDVRHAPENYLLHNIIFYAHSEQALLNHLLNNLNDNAFKYKDRFQEGFLSTQMTSIQGIALNVHTQRNMCKCCATSLARFVSPEMQDSPHGLLTLLTTHIFNELKEVSVEISPAIKSVVVSSYTDPYDPSVIRKKESKNTIRNLMTQHRPDAVTDGCSHESGKLIQYKMEKTILVN